MAANDESFADDFSHEWCQQILTDPSYKRWTPYPRKAAGDNSTYLNLMSKTLSTGETIRALEFFIKRGEKREDGHLIALVSVGGEMCSHTNTLHGGIVTVLVDEIGGGLPRATFSDHMATVNFNVNLRKPVRTPGLILGKAWFHKPPQGRKIWVKTQLEQDGKICVDAESMYVLFDTSKL